MLKFLVPFLPTNRTTDEEIAYRLKTFASPMSRGGYEIDYISLHLDILLLKTVMKYLKCLIENQTLPNNLFFVEYNLGFKLCNHFGLPYNNITPHASVPNKFYSTNVFHIIQKYNLTLEELCTVNVSIVYKRVVYDLNQFMSNFNSHRIVLEILPSYLQTFNYKLHFNLLPLKSMYMEWQLDNNSCCYFCEVGP